MHPFPEHGALYYRLLYVSLKALADKFCDAGNIHTNGKTTTAADLVTPTIKQDFFTTGRGGTGNMMYNDKDHPELARGSQDVEKPPKRSEESVQFTGRGTSPSLPMWLKQIWRIED